MGKIAYLIFLSLLLTGCNNDTKSTLSDLKEDTLPSTEDVLDSLGLTNDSETECDISQVNLMDFTAWQREAGWWVGEYTLLGPTGDPSTSSRWPYRYDHYKGFIHLTVDGNGIKQRNVFLYPAKPTADCLDSTDVVGEGICGVNGNEKIFLADQTATDCKGGLSGPFQQGPFTLNTITTLMGDDTVLYQVYLPDGTLTQNQLTSLPNDTTRVRTAQGFFNNIPTYASYYRETKVTQEVFFEELNKARADYNILPQDACAWDSGNNPSQVTCDEHFELE